MREISKWMVFNAAATVALVLIVAGIAALGWYSNHARINDIQASRIESCRHTYEGIREVFRPFFPPRGHRTKRQRHQVTKFNHQVDRLKRGCVAQTAPKVRP